MGVSVGSSIYNAPSIYESGAGGGGGGGEGLPVGEIVDFPSGYTPLEKIVFEGRLAEGITIPFTGYRSSYNTTENTVQLTAKITNINKQCFCFFFGPNTPQNSLIFNGYTYFIMYSNGGSPSNILAGFQDELKEKFNVSMKYNKAVLNNHVENLPWYTTINTVDSVSIGQYPSSPNDNIDYMEVYAVKIYNPNDDMIFFGVPAFDEANEIDGLLDLITNDFFPHFWRT